jgi:hypothetical protein
MRGTATFPLAVVAAAVAACGGGGDDAVPLQIEPPNAIYGNSVVLKGTSFVPSGSTCPNPGDYIRIGTLGPHTLTYANTTTGVAGGAFSDLWVCNSDEGRTMRWRSHPITLAPGSNVITVRMTTSSRQSEASITLQGGS